MRNWAWLRGVRKTKTPTRRVTLEVEVLEGRQLPSGMPFTMLPHFGHKWSGGHNIGHGGGLGKPDWNWHSPLATKEDSSITVSGTVIEATAGEEFSGIVATFVDSDALAAENYTATIKWGDGTVFEGAVTSNENGGFDISGTHTYERHGRGGKGFPFSGWANQADADENHVYVVSITGYGHDGPHKGKRQVRCQGSAGTGKSCHHIAEHRSHRRSRVLRGRCHVHRCRAERLPESYTAIIHWGDGPNPKASSPPTGMAGMTSPARILTPPTVNSTDSFRLGSANMDSGLVIITSGSAKAPMIIS